MQREWRIAVIFTIILLCTVQVAAHDFWLFPDKFFLKEGTPFKISMLVGQEFEGELRLFKRERTVKFSRYTKEQEIDLIPQSHEGESTEITIKTPGTHLIAFNSANSFIKLTGAEFTSYLQEEGLAQIIKLRSERGESDKPAQEIYRRYVKSLVQVGTVHDATYQRIIGHDLEIVPQQNPYTLKPGDNLTITVLFAGKPLSGAQIRTWYKQDKRAVSQITQTDSQGEAKIKLTDSGSWLISLVHMIPARNKEQADWESFWATLTFGLE